MSYKFEKTKYIFIAAGLVIFFWGSLISNDILLTPFKLNADRIIFNIEEIRQGITYHQHDAIYLPFRVRTLIFNDSIYGYVFLKSASGLITLQNLSDTLLFANLYPLIFGLYFLYKHKKKLVNVTAIVALAIAGFSAGINISPDKFLSFFVASPIFLYLIFSGYQKLNKKIYWLLFVFSMFVIFAL